MPLLPKMFQRKVKAKQELVSDDNPLSMDDDVWEAALEQQRKRKKKMSGVVIGAALCCLPGATLGAFYDDWQASKEAPKMAAALREREANRPPPGSAPALPAWGPETFAIMGDESIQEIVARGARGAASPAGRAAGRAPPVPIMASAA